MQKLATGQPEVRLRPAHPQDGDAIRAIYNAEVTGSQSTFDIIQWTAGDFDSWLARHKGAHPAMVATQTDPGTPPRERPASRRNADLVGVSDLPGSETQGTRPTEPLLGASGETVLGFGSLSRYRSRPAYATTVENSVYVDRLHRGKGIGKLILHELIRLAGEHGFHAVIARVVGHNETSIGLHIACGFELVGVEKEVGRKHGQWLDVVELQRLL